MRSRVFHSGEPAADVVFCLVFPRESLSVPVMRRVLGDTLTRLGIDESCINDMLLAVTEACTNVLRHAGPGRRYELVAHVGSKRCLLEVVDSGRGFDPASIARRRPGMRPSVRPRTQTPPAPDRAGLDRACLADHACAAGSPGPGGWPGSAPSPSCLSPAAAWRSCGPASTT